MTKTFEYRSTGVIHEEEAQFFAFVVRQRFTQDNNRAIQWCRFDGLKIHVDTLEPSVVDLVSITLKDVIETNGGHRWELVG